MRKIHSLCLAAAVAAVGAGQAFGVGPVQTVFIIAMENHNWTQPNGNVGAASTIQQIKNNPSAPFINSLINGTAAGISNQVAYTNTYYNVLANATGSVSIHPSEPNYIWAEAGTNFGVLNDNQPYGSGGTNQNNLMHLSGFLNAAGVSWKSYQEDIDLVPGSGTVNLPGSASLTSVVAPQNQWTSPINNFSGTSTSGAYTNAYNLSHQYDYAVKHNPMAFFSDTNGGNNNSPSNPATSFYAPLQQLLTDLTNHTVARYNWITPNQFNDMHTTLSAGYHASFQNPGDPNLTGDSGKIAQGDDFLRQIIPMIMASQAYQNNGAIIIWNDETESQGTTGDHANDFTHTNMEIVISPLAHANVGGLPYASDGFSYSHSSDLRTMQELFNVGPYLGDAANATDLSDLFASGSVPVGVATNLPEPASLGIFASMGGLLLLRRRR